MAEMQIYPAWKELAKNILHAHEVHGPQFYADEWLAHKLEAPLASDKFKFAWLQCKEALQGKGIEFMRVSAPTKGYKVMSEQEKVRLGFKRRFGKTVRNAKRTCRLAQGVRRELLSEDDAKAHEIQANRAGLLAAVVLQLPRVNDGLRLTLEIPAAQQHGK